MFKVPPDVLPYLRVQHGYVSHIKDDEEFVTAYTQSVANQFRNIAGHLPDHANSCVEIGGGCSGIGILLRRMFGAPYSHMIVDGTDQPAEVRSHATPFAHAEATKSFWVANGCTAPSLYPPGHDMCFDKVDLVLSLAAWGFHLPPAGYADRVKALLKKGTVAIVDTRRHNKAWIADLDELFGSKGEVIFSLPKLERRVWVAN